MISKVSYLVCSVEVDAELVLGYDAPHPRPVFLLLALAKVQVVGDDALFRDFVGFNLDQS